MARAKPLPHVPPEAFAQVRDKVGAKNIEIARALGVSPTRVTELTRTKGGTSRQLARVRDALKTFRGRRRDDRAEAPRKRPGSRSSGSSRSRRQSRSPQPV